MKSLSLDSGALAAAKPCLAARRGCCAPFVRLLCPLRSAIYDAATGDALSMAGNASVLMPLARIAHTILAFGTAQAYNVDGSSPSGRNGRGPALDLGRWPLDGLWEPQKAARNDGAAARDACETTTMSP